MLCGLTGDLLKAMLRLGSVYFDKLNTEVGLIKTNGVSIDKPKINEVVRYCNKCGQALEEEDIFFMSFLLDRIKYHLYHLLKTHIFPFCLKIYAQTKSQFSIIFRLENKFLLYNHFCPFGIVFRIP